MSDQLFHMFAIKMFLKTMNTKSVNGHLVCAKLSNQYMTDARTRAHENRRFNPLPGPSLIYETLFGV